MNRPGTVILLLFLLAAKLTGQDMLQKEITLRLYDRPVKEVLDGVSQAGGVYFTYAGNLELLSKKMTVNYENTPIEKVLQEILRNQGISYTTYANQVILKKIITAEKSIVLRGLILSSENDSPVEFASLQFRKSRLGAIAGFDGKFEIAIPTEALDDSLGLYRLGFESRTISIKSLIQTDFHKIYLQPRPVDLEPVELTSRKAKIEKEGNRGISLGSMYLDTHGQQVALYIENKEKRAAKLKTVSYYLSGKGNAEAPFRIRIYSRNDSLGCPGGDLLPEIVVVKPAIKRGWFKVDISKFNIHMPENGIFIAAEGVYPEDFNSYYNSTGTDEDSQGTSENEDEFVTGSLDYGQRLGYNRKNHNNTWHYSLSNTWFQLDKRNFNVMISSEMVVYENKKQKKHMP